MSERYEHDNDYDGRDRGGLHNINVFKGSTTMEEMLKTRRVACLIRALQQWMIASHHACSTDGALKDKKVPMPLAVRRVGGKNVVAPIDWKRLLPPSAPVGSIHRESLSSKQLSRHRQVLSTPTKSDLSSSSASTGNNSRNPVFLTSPSSSSSALSSASSLSTRSLSSTSSRPSSNASETSARLEKGARYLNRTSAHLVKTSAHFRAASSRASFLPPRQIQKQNSSLEQHCSQRTSSSSSSSSSSKHRETPSRRGVAVAPRGKELRHEELEAATKRLIEFHEKKRREGVQGGEADRDEEKEEWGGRRIGGGGGDKNRESDNDDDDDDSFGSFAGDDFDVVTVPRGGGSSSRRYSRRGGEGGQHESGDVAYQRAWQQQQQQQQQPQRGKGGELSAASISEAAALRLSSLSTTAIALSGAFKTGSAPVPNLVFLDLDDGTRLRLHDNLMLKTVKAVVSTAKRGVGAPPLPLPLPPTLSPTSLRRGNDEGSSSSSSSNNNDRGGGGGGYDDDDAAAQCAETSSSSSSSSSPARAVKVPRFALLVIDFYVSLGPRKAFPHVSVDA